MNKRALVLFFVFAWVVSPAVAQWFPHVALGGGYELILIVTNKLDEPLAGSIVPSQGNFSSWTGDFKVDGIPVSSTSFSFDLPPRGTSRFVLTGDDQLRAGYLYVSATTPHTGTDMDVTCFYNFREGGKLLDSTGVPRAWGSEGFRFAVEKSSTVDTGFAWSALGTQNPFSVTLNLYDSGGTLVQTKLLIFEGHYSRFFDEVFDDIPDGFVGHVELVGEKGLGMTVLRLEWVGSGFQLTSTPPVSFSPQ